MALDTAAGSKSILLCKRGGISFPAMHDAEWSTMWTNVALAGACLYFATSLTLRRRQGNWQRNRLWVYGYLSGAMAALCGALYHGFPELASPGQLKALWNVIILFIGLCGGFMGSAGTLTPFSPSRLSSRLLALGILITAVGFAVQQSQFRAGEQWNHNDYFHLMQIAAFYCLYRGSIAPDLQSTS